MLKKIVKVTIKIILILAILIAVKTQYNTNLTIDENLNAIESRLNKIQGNLNFLERTDMILSKTMEIKGNSLVEIINLMEQQIKEPDLEYLLSGVVAVFGLESQGSGVVIKKTNNKMYILTCNHVIDDIMEFNKKSFVNLGAIVGYIKFDKNYKEVGNILYGAEIIKTDKENDLALLRVDIIDEYLNDINIAEKEPEKGDVVYSVGNPFGLFRTVSKGILSNKIDRGYLSDNTETFGNSGGGLFNKKGELIGITYQVFTYGMSDIMPIAESSLGCSVRLDIIKEFLKGVEY